jgi:hypothetical protein
VLFENCENLYFFLYSEFLLLVGDLFEKWGKVFRLWLGPQLLIVSKDPKDIEVRNINFFFEHFIKIKSCTIIKNIDALFILHGQQNKNLI